MRKNAGQKIIDAYFNSDYYFTKNDKLRVDANGVITSQNTIIGYFDEREDKYGKYQNFLILTLQNFKSQPSWKTHKEQLAKAANEAGYKVIFVKTIDIFYGEIEEPKSDVYKVIPLSQSYKELLEVAKYSQDEDIKTACCGILLEDMEDVVIGYTYNQKIDGEFIHAEDILCEYCNLFNYKINKVVSLLEPCCDCLKKMIELGVEIIIFSQLHKNKWNTTEYIDYTSSIFSKIEKSKSGKPIIYRRNSNELVTKFYRSKNNDNISRRT